MPSTNTTRGQLEREMPEQEKRKRPKRPPLFASDEKANEHDAMYAKTENEPSNAENKPRIPRIFGLILPLSVCVGGALVASVYNIQWLMTVSCIIAGIATVIYFVNSRRRARYQTLSDQETMDRQVADYRRDLLKTLEGYDVDRDMTDEEIEALVDEYRHHLEVENASLANVNVLGVILALFRRKKDDGGSSDGKGKKKGKKEKKDTGRGNLVDE